jgi:hypothetical protein
MQAHNLAEISIKIVAKTFAGGPRKDREIR